MPIGFDAEIIKKSIPEEYQIGTSGIVNGSVNGFSKEYQNGTNGDMDTEDKDNQKIGDLNEKIRAQDLEIYLLKCALSDVLSRVNKMEESYHENTMDKKTKSNGTTKSVVKSKILERKQRSQTVSNINMEKSKPAASNISKKPRPLSVEIPKSKTNGNHQNSPDKKKSPPEKMKLDVPETDRKLDSPETPDKPKIILAKRPSASKKRASFNASRSSSTDDSKSPINDFVKFNIRGRQLKYYVPSDYSSTKEDGTLPDKKLELQWVHGYRGKDSRDNLFQLESGELVYNMAGVVIIYDPIQQKQRYYLEHTDDVRAIGIHPNLQYVASGQVAGHSDEDGKPHVRVWNAETLETVSSFGHGVLERGVSGIEFLSMENCNYVLVIDEVNVVYLYDWVTGELITEAKGSNEPIFSVKRNPYSSTSFVTYGKSHLGLWKIQVLETNKLYLNKKLAVYDKIDKPKFALNAVFTDDGHVISGDSNGSILLYMFGCNRPAKAAQKVHKGGVVALVKLEGKDEIVSCGKDGEIALWNSNLEKIKELGTMDEQYGLARVITPINNATSYLIGTSRNCILQYDEDFENPEVIVQGHSDEMWGLAVHPTEPLFVTCSHEKLVCLWSSVERKNLWSYLLDDSAVSATFHPNEPIIAIGTNNGKLCFLDYDKQEELLTLPTSRDNIDDVKFSPDCSYVAATCRDSNIYLYSFPKGELTFKKPKVLQGHSSRVLHIDWSADSEFMQSNSSDYETLYWQAESALQVLSPNALRNVEWSTWTNPFGFPVMGIWPEGADGTDINACSRSCNKDLVASGDDFGQVKLFRYPSVKLKSDGHVGSGHSSHVTCVRFLKEDSGLVTVGGKDSSVMQWKLVDYKKDTQF